MARGALSASWARARESPDQRRTGRGSRCVSGGRGSWLPRLPDGAEATALLWAGDLALRPVREITWDETDACIEWPHARSKSGYGQTWRNGKVVYVHRVVWEQIHGRALAAGEEIRHTCDNKPCFNPRHLLVGSRIDNVRDAIERNRMRYPNRIPDDIVAGWVERYRAGESSEVSPESTAVPSPRSSVGSGSLTLN